MAKKKTALVPAKKASKKITVEATRMSKSETAMAAAAATFNVKMPPKDLATMTVAEKELRLKTLLRTYRTDEPEISALIYELTVANAPIDHGYEPREYWDDYIGITYHRAKALCNTWKALVDLGVDNFKKLAGLGWDKLKALRVGIEARVINKRNIEAWLRKCGDGSLATLLLEGEIKALIRSVAKETVDDSVVTVKFKVPKYDLETIDTFMVVAKKVLQVEDRGLAFMKALIEFSSNHANVMEAAWWKSMGLVTMKEMIERVSPVAVVLFPLAEEQVKGAGALPTPKLYQAYLAPAGSTVRDLKYCLARTEKEAKELFGSGAALKKFELKLAKSLLPATPFQEIGEESVKAAEETVSIVVDVVDDAPEIMPEAPETAPEATVESTPEETPAESPESMPEAELAPQDEDSQEVPHDTLQVATSHQVEAPQETPPAEAPQVAAPQAKTPKMNPKTAALVEAIKAEVLRLRKSAGYTTDDYTRLKTRLEKKGLKGETLLTEILTCLKKK
jgi:hypothetical protein